MEKLYIGDMVILDTRSRVLSRLDKPYKVTLGVSACHCIEELIKAQGGICSQDELLNKGWKQLNLEVTTSSLRVVISQIRKALLFLKIEKQVQIVTVPRTGYRMLATVETEAPTEVEAPIAPSLQERMEQVSQPIPDEFETPESHPSPPTVHSLLRYVTAYRIRPRVLLFIPACLITAAMLTWVLSPWYWKSVAGIQFVPYVGPELGAITAEANVFIDPLKSPTPARVLNTLELWKKYASDVNKWKYIYVSDGTSSYLYSLFACTRPLKENQNDCASFVFKTP